MGFLMGPHFGKLKVLPYIKLMVIPKISKIILVIVLAQFTLTSAFGLLAPIFAVFVSQQIVGGSVAVVGFVISIYWIIKSVLQLFVARFIDRNHGEIDDFYFYIAGGFLNAVAISLYFFATEVWHVYAIHSLIAVADAMLVPPFYAIFTRHVDSGQEGFEWSLYSSFSIGAGSALGGALGGVLATVVGFRAVFPLVGFLTFVATSLMFLLRPYILPKVPQGVSRVPIDVKKI